MKELGRDTSDSVLEHLTLVLGPPNSGKMGYLLDWWQERIQTRPVLVTPTHQAAMDLSQEMVRRAGALAGASLAMTFDGLVQAMLGRSFTFAGGAERLLMAARLLGRGDLKVLAPVAGLPGTLQGLAKLLEQLDDSDRDPEGVKRALSAWGASSPDSAELAEELGRLHGIYTGFCNSLGLTSRAAAVREAAAMTAEWKRPVGFYGFTSFTLAQRSLIVALARQVEVVVVLPHDASREVSLCPPAEIAWWRKRAGRLVQKSRKEHAYSSPAIVYLERYFASRYSPVESPPASSSVEGVTFVLCAGRRAELEAAAERIAQLVNSGFSPGDIAVLVRSMREWRALVRQVFDSCGVPYELDERLVLRETGLGYSLWAALRGVAKGEAGDLFVFLRSPYSGEDFDRVCELERRYLARRLKGTQALIGLAGEMGLESVKDLEGLVEIGGREGSEGRGEIYLDLHAARILVRKMLVRSMRGVLSESEIDEDVRAYLALNRLFQVLGGLPREFRDVQSILRVLPDLPVPGRRLEHSEAVQVMTISRARARRFGAVFLLGLVEGEFPRKGDLPSLLSSRQRSELNRSAGGRLLSEEEEQEEALFLAGVSRAWQVLVLSAREADDDGSKTEVSRFWTEAGSLLGVDRTVLQRRTLADQVFAPDKAPCPREYVRACLARGFSPNPAVVSASEVHAGQPALSWGQPPYRLTSPAALGELRSMQSFSPSVLEAFSRCPFAWFIERVVGVEEFGAEFFDKRVVGELLHRVLSRIYRELSGRGLLPLSAESLEAAKVIADEAVGTLLESEAVAGTYGERRLLAARLRALAFGLFELEISRGFSLRPLMTEKWVGGSEGVDIGGLRVRGRIDRIDVVRDGEAFFVLDYKSGRVPGAAQLATPDDLQLALYLLALTVVHPHREVVGGAYVSPAHRAYTGVLRANWRHAVGTRTTGFRVLEESEWVELLERARNLARAAAEGIRSGIIAPRADNKCPEWCGLGPVCRSERKGRRR